MLRPIERIVDLLDPRLNQIHNMSIDEARRRVLAGDPADVRAIDGSFALIAVDGATVRMARSLDRPMRYFLAKRHEGPALLVADRIDTLQRALDGAGLGQQFHPSYTRMIPAHHVVELALVGCPDPDPLYTRFFSPARAALPPDLDEIGRRYIGALAEEIRKWLLWVERESNGSAPIGVSFSGGVDSGSVFLVTYWILLQLGLSPARLSIVALPWYQAASISSAGSGGGVMPAGTSAASFTTYATSCHASSLAEPARIASYAARAAARSAKVRSRARSTSTWMAGEMAMITRPLVGSTLARRARRCRSPR
jgi:asparagine synthase (glutamine-hydrolysing)